VETLVSYLKFPPDGTRAVAPGWGNSDYRGVTDWQSWMDEQDEETTVVLHFETKRAYENAEELISVPGVDMVYCGPGDSSIELGHPGDYDHADVRGAMEDVLELCKKYGVAFGTTPSGGKGAGEWVRKGASWFEADSEIGFIRAGAAALIADYQSHINQ
jgi:4-hydroxy-2-oxoheptanedioate aldolase